MSTVDVITVISILMIVVIAWRVCGKEDSETSPAPGAAPPRATVTPTSANSTPRDESETPSMIDDLIDFSVPAPRSGPLDVRWIHGVSPTRTRAGEPQIQAHHYDEHTVILRQSKSVNYEAPFMFLLFGNHRALLVDTGATTEPDLFPLRLTVDRLISE